MQRVLHDLQLVSLGKRKLYVTQQAAEAEQEKIKSALEIKYFGYLYSEK